MMGTRMHQSVAAATLMKLGPEERTACHLRDRSPVVNLSLTWITTRRKMTRERAEL